MIRLVIASSFLILAALCQVSCSTSDAHQAERTWNDRAPAAPDQSLRVESLNGPITVVADSSVGEARIEAVFRCSGMTLEDAERRVNAAYIEVSRGVDRGLTIRPVFPEPRRSGDFAALTVTVAGARGVELVSDNGAVEARGLSGLLRVETGNGTVRLIDHDGSAELNSGNGSMRVQRLDGGLKVRTGNGSVNLVDIDGPVTAATGNGSIRLDGAAGPVDLVSGNGEIDLALRAGQQGPLAVRSGNGRITATLGHGFDGVITLQGHSRDVEMDESDRARVLKQDQHTTVVEIGDGGPSSRLESSQGRVTLRLVERMPPASPEP